MEGSNRRQHLHSERRYAILAPSCCDMFRCVSVLASDSKDEELHVAARRVLLVQSTVAAFAARHSAEDLSAAFREALPRSGAHAATVLAVAAAHRGAPLEADVVRQLLPELDTIALFGPLVFAASGDPLGLLIRFLDDGTGAWEREALAILLATDLLDGKHAPPRLLVHARRLARRPLGTMAALVFGAAAARLADPHVDALAAHFIALARGDAKLATATIEAARQAPLGVLPTAASPRISSGYTIRNEGRDVGRNDPCPCGSGKKYKKCCSGNVTEMSAEPPAIEPALLTPDQVSELRPSAIVELDPGRLSRLARIAGFRKLITYRRWGAAERILDAMRAGISEEEAWDWYEELVDGAIQQRAYDVVERLVVRLPADRRDRRLQILTECIRRPPDLLDRLHEHARVALEEESGETLVSLGFALLDYFPALGVLVARAALNKQRQLDSFTLLNCMEEARDELGIAPFEPWWDVWEEINDRPDRSAMTASQRDTIEKITSELRRARQKADEAATEAARLQGRLKTLESAAAPSKRDNPENPAPRAEPAAPAKSADVGLEAEKKRLRAKVEELQRIVSQGQEERRELRQRLATATSRSAGPPSSDVSRERDAERDDIDEALEPVDRPRRVVVPAFTTRASKAIADLPAETAESVLVLVAELAAGRENAWNGVKQLRRRQILSARAGIHYRVLFRVGDGVIDVIHVTHRRDLEQVIANFDP